MPVWFFRGRLAATAEFRGVWTQDPAVAAACTVDAQRWSEPFGELMATIGARFARPESRAEFGTSSLGCYVLAERHGHQKIDQLVASDITELGVWAQATGTALHLSVLTRLRL